MVSYPCTGIGVGAQEGGWGADVNVKQAKRGEVGAGVASTWVKGLVPVGAGETAQGEVGIRGRGTP